LADTGRFADSILPRVSLSITCFEGQKEERSFVPSVSTIMSIIDLFGHTWIDLELLKIQCVYVSKTADHLIWHSERFKRDTDLLMHCPSWMCYMRLLFGICVVYESEVLWKFSINLMFRLLHFSTAKDEGIF
jgi:hypothetical protein